MSAYVCKWHRRANRADECPLLGHTGKLVLDLSFSGFDVVDGARSQQRGAVG